MRIAGHTLSRFNLATLNVLMKNEGGQTAVVQAMELDVDDILGFFA